MSDNNATDQSLNLPSDNENQPAENLREAIDPDRIREAAYSKWEAAGCPCCDGVEFWLDIKPFVPHRGDKR